MNHDGRYKDGVIYDVSTEDQNDAFFSEEKLIF